MSVFGIRDDRWTKAVDLGAGTHNQARSLRQLVQDYNDHFGIDGQYDYILSGPRGYRLTSDLNEIQAAIGREFMITGDKFRRLHSLKHRLEMMRIEQMMLEDL